MITYAIGGVRDIDEDQLYQGEPFAQTPAALGSGGSRGRTPDKWRSCGSSRPLMEPAHRCSTGRRCGPAQHALPTPLGGGRTRRAVQHARRTPRTPMHAATRSLGNPPRPRSTRSSTAMRGLTKVPVQGQPPCWIDGKPRDPGTP